MNRNHVRTPASVGALALVAALLPGGSLLSGCCHPSRPVSQPSVSAETSAERRAIEHLIGGRLPDSARQCRYYSKSFGMGSGLAWMYFEMPQEDLLRLLDACPDLPDRSKLGQSPGVQENIEKSVERNQETIPWWRPWELRNRQYGVQATSFDKLGVFGYQLDICIGELQDGLCGIYLVRRNDM